MPGQLETYQHFHTFEIEAKIVRESTFRCSACFEYDFPISLKHAMSKEEFDGLLQQINSEYNEECLQHYKLLKGKMYRNIPLLIVPLVNVVRIIQLQKFIQDETNNFERRVCKRFNHINKQHNFDDRNIQIRPVFRNVASGETSSRSMSVMFEIAI